MELIYKFQGQQLYEVFKQKNEKYRVVRDRKIRKNRGLYSIFSTLEKAKDFIEKSEEQLAEAFGLVKVNCSECIDEKPFYMDKKHFPGYEKNYICRDCLRWH